MPYTLNGTFYTIDEVMRPLGRTYSIGCRWIKRMGMSPMVIARTMLLNEDEKKAMEDFADRMDNYENCIPIREAAKKEYLNVRYRDLEQHVRSGAIPSTRDTLGKYRLTDETIYIIQQSALCQGKNTNWAKVVALFEDKEEV